MAAIGTGWVDGAWVEAGWISGAWAAGVAALGEWGMIPPWLKRRWLVLGKI